MYLFDTRKLAQKFLRICQPVEAIIKFKLYGNVQLWILGIVRSLLFVDKSQTTLGADVFCGMKTRP